jgi:hypothetical protein
MMSDRSQLLLLHHFANLLPLHILAVLLYLAVEVLYQFLVSVQFLLVLNDLLLLQLELRTPLLNPFVGLQQLPFFFEFSLFNFPFEVGLKYVSLVCLLFMDPL